MVFPDDMDADVNGCELPYCLEIQTLDICMHIEPVVSYKKLQFQRKTNSSATSNMFQIVSLEDESANEVVVWCGVEKGIWCGKTGILDSVSLTVGS